ncbi:exopolysaccharide biosynthesis protein [Allorhizobium undicola]|uniref:exopolysaccharide biosynthesis protein n=1 Tax=Allorhizobium undicola TaxID=78527 RepID=UPI003D357E2F
MNVKNDPPYVSSEEPVLRGSDFLLQILERARAENGIEIDAIIGHRGRIGVAFTLLILALPTIIPLPGPFGMVFGTCLAIVALQMLWGADRLWFPAFIGRRRLPLKVVEAMARVGHPWVLRAEGWLENGRLGLLTGKSARILLAIPILLLAVLIALPIPFGNTVPALAVILIAISLAERDGLVVLFAMGVAVAACVTSYLLFGAAHSALSTAMAG